MATRRNFFMYLGLAGGVATGGVVAAAAVLPDAEKCEAIKEIKAAGYNGKLNIGTESMVNLHHQMAQSVLVQNLFQERKSV